jgi:hypothetical protein
MRMTPAQMALALICGEKLPPMVPTPEDMCDRLRGGRARLVEMSGKDFGYDLQAWHDYLKESRDGGYKYGRNIALPKMMKAAMESPEWQAAVKRLKDQGSN